MSDPTRPPRGRFVDDDGQVICPYCHQSVKIRTGGHRAQHPGRCVRFAIDCIYAGVTHAFSPVASTSSVSNVLIIIAGISSVECETISSCLSSRMLHTDSPSLVQNGPTCLKLRDMGLLTSLLYPCLQSLPALVKLTTQCRDMDPAQPPLRVNLPQSRELESLRGLTKGT